MQTVKVRDPLGTASGRRAVQWCVDHGIASTVKEGLVHQYMNDVGGWFEECKLEIQIACFHSKAKESRGYNPMVDPRRGPDGREKFVFGKRRRGQQ